MRKITLLLAIFAIAAPSVANAKHRRHRPPAPVVQTDPNEKGRKLVWNGLMQVFVPMRSMTK